MAGYSLEPWISSCSTYVRSNAEISGFGGGEPGGGLPERSGLHLPHGRYRCCVAADDARDCGGEEEEQEEDGDAGKMMIH